jgi:uncharacterized protein (TIGR02757 family)
MSPDELKEFLWEKAAQYEVPDFVPRDPLSIPHRYTDLRDVEVAGLFAATLAWGNRRTIVANLESLMARMDDAPSEFVRNHSAKDLEVFEGFVHRTFQAADAKGFVRALRAMYTRHDSLEDVFLAHWKENPDRENLKHALAGFHHDFANCDGVEARTRKHVANPLRGSAAKRLNMYLRWMVRSSARGVDLGRWTRIPTSVLSIPLDVHTSNVGRSLGLLTRTANDWRAVEELTAALRALDPVDPVRFDFALFGLGAMEGF